MIFFNLHEELAADIRWQIPWVLVVVVSAGNLLISPIIAVLEGCGLVAQVALVRVVQAIAGSALTWAVLAANGKLYAAPVVNAVILLGWVGWLLFRKRAFLKDLLAALPTKAASTGAKRCGPSNGRSRSAASAAISSSFSTTLSYSPTTAPKSPVKWA